MAAVAAALAAGPSRAAAARRTGHRAGGPRLSVGRSAPVGAGRRHAANLGLAQRVPLGPAGCRIHLVRGRQTPCICSKPRPAPTGSARCSTLAGPRRHCWWRWPAGRPGRRPRRYRDADSAPTPRRWRAPSWRWRLPSGPTIRESRSTLAALSLIAVAARFSVTFRDVSIMAENHKHAMTDELTTLPNRRSLATALTAAVTAPTTRRRAPAGDQGASASSAAAAAISTSSTRSTTRSVSHFGDELLCHIANRLSADRAPRGSAAPAWATTSSRSCWPRARTCIAARAQAGRLLEALVNRSRWTRSPCRSTRRIAIALYPDHCDHPQELLNRAETRHAARQIRQKQDRRIRLGRSSCNATTTPTSSRNCARRWSTATS